MLKMSVVSLEWLTAHALDIEKYTYEMYKSKVKFINEFFLNKYIDDISYIDIQSFINHLFTDKNFSKSTIKKYKVTLNQIFNYALMYKNLKFTPLQSIKIPKKAEVRQIDTISKSEIDLIINNKHLEMGFYAFFMLLTGLRRSELLALNYEDINLDEKVISINKKVIFDKGKPILKKVLKNNEKERLVNLPDILVDEILKRHRHTKGLIFFNEKLLTIR